LTDEAGVERRRPYNLAIVPPACITVALLALALPILLVRVPPLLDFPNHLARIWLLAGGIDAPPLSRIYTVDWAAAWTNIGVDLLGATVGRLTGGETLAGILLAAALILPPLGAILLNRAVFGGWHWWQVGFALLAWNTTLLAGFLNFQIGLGLALLAAAAHTVVSRWIRPPGVAVMCVALGLSLLVWHVFAAAFYGALLAGLAVGMDRVQLSGAAAFTRAVLRSAVALLFALVIPLTIFLLVAPAVPGVQAPPGAFEGWGTGYSFRNKWNVLRSALVTYDQRIDVVLLLGLAIPVAVGAVGWLAASRASMRVHVGLATAALGLGLLAVLVPSTLSGTGFVDWRFPIMAALTAAAALRPGFCSSQRAASVAACVLLVMALGRTAWIESIWQARQADVASVARALRRVPAGAAVLPAEHVVAPATPVPRGRYFFWGGLPSFDHYPALAVPWRHAFVPTLFTTSGKQSLQVRAAWRDIAVPEGTPAPVHALASFMPTAANRYFFGYVQHWREHFDYVLVINADLPDADGEPPRLPDLELVADEGFARLYRNVSVRHATEPAEVSGTPPAR
jgi:hypothetical protein